MAASAPAFIHEVASVIEDAGPAPHGGAGDAVYHRFFDGVGTPLYFNCVALTRESSIGRHLQAFDEIFYVVEGRGLMQVDEETFEVQRGSAVLTRAGHHHSLAQAGDESLVVIIVHAARRGGT